MEPEEQKFAIKLADGLYYAGKVPGVNLLRRTSDPKTLISFPSRSAALGAMQDLEFANAMIVTLEEAIAAYREMWTR